MQMNLDNVVAENPVLTAHRLGRFVWTHTGRRTLKASVHSRVISVNTSPYLAVPIES